MLLEDNPLFKIDAISCPASDAPIKIKLEIPEPKLDIFPEPNAFNALAKDVIVELAAPALENEPNHFCIVASEAMASPELINDCISINELLTCVNESFIYVDVS